MCKVFVTSVQFIKETFSSRAQRNGAGSLCPDRLLVWQLTKKTIKRDKSRRGIVEVIHDDSEQSRT